MAQESCKEQVVAEPKQMLLEKNATDLLIKGAALCETTPPGVGSANHLRWRKSNQCLQLQQVFEE